MSSLPQETYLQYITNVDYTLPRGSRFSASPVAWPFTVDGYPGLNLWEALHGRLDHLDGARDPFFEGCGTKITYRILVDGYREFSKQMNAQRRHRGVTLPIPRFKVAKQIAQVVVRFLEWASEMTMGGELRFGTGYITLEQIYLVELRQVSPASFQPILAVLRRPQPVLPMPLMYAQAGATSGRNPEPFIDGDVQNLDAFQDIMFTYNPAV